MQVSATVNSPWAIWKSLRPLLDFASHSVRVEFSAWSFVYKPPIRVGLSPTLWRKDRCQRCGRSCEGFALAFLPTEELPAALNGGIETIDLFINGKKNKVSLYRQRHLRGDKGCDFLKGPLRKIGACSCSIHLHKPLHCWLPHMRVLRNHTYNYAIIARTQYGRNWALGCPVAFDKPANWDQVREDQTKLERLQSVSESLGISTRIPALIIARRAQGLNIPKRVIYV